MFSRYSCLNREAGAVALETYLSVVMIFTISIIFWGVAAMLANQSTLNGATQLAAQESLMAYDRLTYTNDPRSGVVASSINTANIIANDIYLESAHGLIDDQLKSTHPTPDAIKFSLLCASDYSSNGGIPGSVTCGSAGSFVETVLVRGGAPGAVWLLAPLSGVGYNKQSLHIHSSSQATSSGACTSLESPLGSLQQC